ncbi:MAG TPA: hypothetical protein VIJ93_11000 [bacterium]
MSEKNYLKLTGSFYFDPIHKHILKKQGGTYSFVLHDRRRTHKPVSKDRRSRLEAMPIHLKPIIQGLFWDSENKYVYKKIGGNFVLYSKDRRKSHGPSPTGSDRRLVKGQ